MKFVDLTLLCHTNLKFVDLTLLCHLVKRADYGTTNADEISKNYGVVKINVDKSIGKMAANGFYSPKANVIGHSMGGLLTREYCRMNQSECKKKIYKFVSIDTPHKGSEMAQLLFEIDKAKPYWCYNVVLAKVDKKKAVWADPSRTKLKGALLDLIPGSTALTSLNASILPFNWTAIAGVAESGQIYDEDLAELWKYLQLICGYKPDNTFSNMIRFETPVFNISNDRIVNLTSQNGDAPSTFKIPNVDHSAVLKSISTVDKVRKLIEN